MAARLNPRNAEATRQKIQTTQLVKRLQDHAFDRVEMTKTQVAAAIFLINKRIPNPPEEMNHNLEGEFGVKVSFIDPPKAKILPGH